MSTLAWPAGRVPEEVSEIQENEARRVIADAIKVVESHLFGYSERDADPTNNRTSGESHWPGGPRMRCASGPWDVSAPSSNSSLGA